MNFKYYYNRYIIFFTMIVAIIALVCKKCFGTGENMISFGKSIKTLVNMNKSDYNAFMNSYDVFDDPKYNKDDENKVNSFYNVLVPLMELGSLKKFYIPPLMDPNRKKFYDLSWNQELFERKMTDAMQLGPGKVVLDIGCGTGLIANLVQEHSGAKVVGINISPKQISKAKENAIANGKLGTKLEFKQGSINDKLEFPDNSFDAVYIVQVDPYAHNYSFLMSEVRRVLKPGGIFSDIAVPTLNGFDPTNENHLRMAREAKRVGGIPVWRSVDYYLKCCTDNGFSIILSEHLKNYEMMQVAMNFFYPLGTFIKFLNNIGLVNNKIVASLDRMNEHAISLIEGDRQELFTTNYWILCRANL